MHISVSEDPEWGFITIKNKESLNEFDSMSEAVDAAIQQAAQLKYNQIVVADFSFHHPGSPFPLRHDPYSLDDDQSILVLRDWAKRFDDAFPPCCHCGKPCFDVAENRNSDWTGSVFCSEHCAEMDWTNEDDDEPETVEGVPEDLDEFLGIVENVFGDECFYRTSEDEDEFEWEQVRGWRNSLTISCLRYKLEWVVSDNAVRGQGETFEDAAREYFLSCGVDPERAAAMAAGENCEDEEE